GDDIIGVGGDGGRCGGGGGCGGLPLVELREERIRGLGLRDSFFTITLLRLRLWRRVWREISSRLIGDSLREVGGRGDRARVPRGRSRCESTSGSERVLRSSDRFVARVILLDRSGCPIWARLLLATVEDSLRAVWDVDVDEVLGVECVDLALAGSHDGWGEDGKVRVLRKAGAHHPTYGKGKSCRRGPGGR
ncbi:hypothetical protein POSPLADRAFT_1110361, partial [Postia placenta MAD-698-R-SB12]